MGGRAVEGKVGRLYGQPAKPSRLPSGSGKMQKAREGSSPTTVSQPSLRITITQDAPSNIPMRIFCLHMVLLRFNQARAFIHGAYVG